MKKDLLGVLLFTVVAIIGLIAIAISYGCSQRTYNFYVWQNGNMQYAVSEEVDDKGNVVKKWAASESLIQTHKKGLEGASASDELVREYASGTQVVNVHLQVASERPTTVTPTTDLSLDTSLLPK
jgi:hypothetical protein